MKNKINRQRKKAIMTNPETGRMRIVIPCSMFFPGTYTGISINNVQPFPTEEMNCMLPR